MRGTTIGGKNGGRRSGSPKGIDMWEMGRRYSNSALPGNHNSATNRRGPSRTSAHAFPSNSHTSTNTTPTSQIHAALPNCTSEDMHAWSIYRQNLNSDFTDSALGSSEKSPLPYGNFQLRESTVQSILSHPRFGPKSPLGANMFTYLKFGLPRVLPPNGKRDESSGYDSSEEGGVSARTLHEKAAQAYYLRARSDPDFRNAPFYGQTPKPVDPSTCHTRGKSMSEANLLSSEALSRHMRPMPKSYRRSVHDLRAASELHPHHRDHSHFPNGRPASIAIVGKGGSQSLIDMNNIGCLPSHYHASMDAPPRSMTSRQSYPAFQTSRSDAFNGQYPHLQVCGLDVEFQKDHLQLQSITFEVKAGELLGIMSTSVKEGTALLDALAGRRKCRAQRVILNGQNLGIDALKKRLVYVRHDARVSPDLNVAQTLTFHSHLRQMPKLSLGKTTMSDQVSMLIEELGLNQILQTNVSDLTPSEIQRLKIACYLLSDAEILLLDRPTSAMDIFDTFFLVEFLRQWASGGPAGLAGKIVILTLQPPTYEIFTMVSRVALISCGRVMFFGRRKEMLPYFASVEYPCPAFKNPSDYYLDLVTLDELSAEAMLESSQRIEQLTAVFHRRQQPLADPGPRQPLPAKPRNASFVFQIVAIILRQTVYAQPNNFFRWLSHLLAAFAFSMLVGAVFWDVPATDPTLIFNDRLGYHYSVMQVAALPLLLLRSQYGVRGKDREAVESDMADGLYGRFAYIVTTLICRFPASILFWLGYIIPAYALSALNQQDLETDAFYTYCGYMILHMMALQSTLTLLAYLLPSSFSFILLSSLFLLAINSTSGVPLHLQDLPEEIREWFGVISPTRWILPIILQSEFSPETLASQSSHLVCRNKQIQRQDIIVQLPCPTPNGTAALRYYGLRASEALPNHFSGAGSVSVVLYAIAICVIFTIIAFTTVCRFYRKKSTDK